MPKQKPKKSSIVFEKQGAQGDVYFIRRESIPSDYAPAAPSGGVHVVAHSETGHHHVVDMTQGALYEGSNPLVGYLKLEGVDPCDIVHKRDFHTHQTVSLGGGAGAIWEVRRQREYTSEGLRRAAD
jgi:hypothetical protein